jgi:class 3 adenylate cyclase/tetratricopeptide (TPR) repeat protein
VATCSSCGRELSGEFAFCPFCGALLSEQKRSSVREERKVVSVLFCDLVGFTASSDAADPEDVRARIRPYHARLRQEIERFGGTVEKFIGDAVMAVFGAPVAHEDDAERAVRAALRILEAIDELNEEDPPLGLQVRVGINTGEAVVALGARPEAGEGIVTGDVVNTAARLQAAAPVNGILVGESTHRATERAIAYREHEPIEAKGKAQPVTAWAAVDALSHFGVDVDQAPRTSLVGRDRELGLVREAFEQMREQREPQLVTLVGVPGIGKSRLVHELSMIIDRDPELVSWRQGRCLPYGEGISFWALTEMVKAQAGILESEGAESVAAKLGASVAALVPAEDREWIERWVRPLVGLAGGEAGEHGTRDEAFPAWRRYLECIADQGPTVLIFEDLHWADEGLLDFLDDLSEWTSEVPLLVFCTARPELLARRPSWGGGRTNALTISLRPLSNDETARLVHEVLERAVLPAELQHELIERAGGNPLYAEEFARMHAERGESELSVPETVQGIIAARLDALPPEHKRLLQNAAVVGKVFWAGAVAALNGADSAEIEPRLHELERREFVRRERRSSVEREAEYAFRHVLVRDVAYGQIPRAQRADKHCAAAEWIASLGRPDDHGELLAYHYLEALEYTRSANRDTAKLGAAALKALREAGDRAFALGAYSSAARYFGSALELASEDDHERGELLFRYGSAQFWSDTSGEVALKDAVSRLRNTDPEAAARSAVLLSRAAWYHRDPSAVDAWLAEVDALLENIGDSIVTIEALVVRAGFHMVAGEYEQAIRLARDALARLKETDRPDLRARAFDVIGCSRVARGDEHGIDDQRRAIEIAREGRALWEFHHAINNLAYSKAVMGRLYEHDELLADWRRAFDEVGGLAYNREWLTALEVETDYNAGRWDAALDKIDQFLVGPAGEHYLEPTLRELRTRIFLARNRLSEARADIDRAVAAAADIGRTPIMASVLCARALVLIAQGCKAEAVHDFDQLVSFGGSIADAHSELPSFAWVAVDLGRERDAEQILNEAPAWVWKQVARAILDRDATTAVGLLAETGHRPAEAYARLRAGGAYIQRALEFFYSVGATRYIHETEQPFAETV